MRTVEAAEAVLAEWTGPADMDAALDYYNQIVDLVQGPISRAQGARDVNAALASVLAGMWLQIEATTKRSAGSSIRSPTGSCASAASRRSSRRSSGFWPSSRCATHVQRSCRADPDHACASART
jgi:hypothetical protein